MEAREWAENIVHKYSNMERDETCCRASDLIRDISQALESVMREHKQAVETHEAWLRIHGDIERNRPFLSRFFA